MNFISNDMKIFPLNLASVKQYITGSIFGVKIYNTTVRKSNFKVKIHDKNLGCRSYSITLYGCQRGNKLTDGNLESNLCTYRASEGELWPYIYMKVCEIIFG